MKSGGIGSDGRCALGGALECLSHFNAAFRSSLVEMPITATGAVNDVR